MVHYTLQCRSDVSGQDVASRSSRLETRFSKIARVKSRVEFQDFRGEPLSFESRI